MHDPDATGTEPWIRGQSRTLDDPDSLYGNAKFVNPEAGDFTVAEDSPALALGFKNFPMTGFGVTSERLKAVAEEPELVLKIKITANEKYVKRNPKLWGAEYKKVETQAELYGFRSDDVVLKLNGRKINRNRFSKTMRGLEPGTHRVEVWRGQLPHTFEFEVKK